MAKLSLSPISSGYASIDALNANFAAIEAALNNTVSRDGSAPNYMEASLDMNGQSILNAGGVYVNGEELVTLLQTLYDNVYALLSQVTISTSSPSGGNDGDIWFKVV